MRGRAPFLWAALVVLAVPALAQAQLFPRMPIRRERVPSCQEDPIYRAYRQQYFGYFPTCWCRFPAGWGCVKTEGPNITQSFEEIPLRLEPTARTGAGTDTGLPEPGVGPGPAPNAAPPPLPSERGPSPFDIQPKPGAETPLMPDTDNPPARPAPPRDRQGDAPPPAAPGTNSAALRGAGPSDSAGLPPLAPPSTNEPSPPADAAPAASVPGPGASVPPPRTLAPQRRGPVAGLFSGFARRR